MKRLAQAFDGPTRARDLAAMFAPGMLALWMCFLHATIGGALGGMLFYSASEHDAVARASSILGLGQYLAVTLLLAFGVLFTLVIPMRAAGTIEMPRLGRYFDQLVLSGVAPARLFGGRLVAVNAFGLLLVAGAMPYAIFALSLGGTRAAYVVIGFVALFAYANVLALATLAAGVFMHEALAALVVIAAAGGVYFLGLFPIPAPLVGALTPSSLLVRPYWEATGSLAELDAYVGSRGGAANGVLAFLNGVDPLLLYLVGAAVLAALFALALCLGPARCLVHETGAFGEVVMDGDTRRAGFMRKRFVLRRRSELAFFYENTPASIRRWEAPLRYGTWLTVFFLATAGASATTIGVAHLFRSYQWYALAMFELGILLGLACLVFTSDRATLGTRLSCGARRASVAALDPIAFVAIAALVTFATRFLPRLLDQAGLMWVVPPSDPRDYQGRMLDVAMPMTLVCVVQVYAAAQFLACKAWNQAVALLSASGLMFVVWFAPWVTALIMLEGARYAGPQLPAIGIVASLSPLTPYTVAFDSSSRLGRLLVTHGDLALAFGVQLALVGVLALAALARRGRLVAERAP